MNKIFYIVVLGILVSAATAFLYPLGGDDYHHTLAGRDISKNLNFADNSYFNCYNSAKSYPPLWHLAAAFPLFFFSGNLELNIFSIKAMQVFIGAMLILVLIALMKKADYRTKLISVFFLSLYGLRVIYSARPHVDILVSLGVALSVYTYYKWKEYGRKKDFIFLGIFSGLTAMTHIYGFIVYILIFVLDAISKNRNIKSLTLLLMFSSLIPLFYLIFVSGIFSLPVEEREGFFSGPPVTADGIFYEAWLGVPTSGEPQIRSQIFSRATEFLGFDAKIPWLAAAGLLSLILIYGATNSERKYILWFAIFLIPLFVKGMPRMLLVPALIPIAIFFGNGVSKIKSKLIVALIVILFLIISIQPLLFAYKLNQEKSGYDKIFSDIKQELPQDAKIIVFGSSEIARVNLYTGRRTFYFGDAAKSSICLNDNSNITGFYLYVDSRIYDRYSAGSAQRERIDRLTSNTLLMKNYSENGVWAKLYFSNSSASP